MSALVTVAFLAAPPALDQLRVVYAFQTSVRGALNSRVMQDLVVRPGASPSRCR
jgi:hypothetical protein